jgi:hypothetical protein
MIRKVSGDAEGVDVLPGCDRRLARPPLRHEGGISFAF